MDDKYDILITDGQGESHGFVCDWQQGGAGLTIEKGEQIGSTTAVSTKGNYGVRDVNDHQRIIQTDWSQGSGQKTYDREADSESAFDSSMGIDVSTVGEFKLGPKVTMSSDSATVDVSTQQPVIIAHGKNGSDPLLWASFSDDTDTEKRIAWSSDGLSWTCLSNGSSPGPTSSPTSFASDGETLYAAANGAWRVGAAQATQVGAETGITHVAFTAGYLYGAKGTTSTDAQVGWFASDDSWTALSPEEGTAINAAGATFGLVALGTYVYWGITNGMLTKVFKARYGGGGTVPDVLAEVAVFPSGFVGASMYAYLDTVYVGGHFDGATANSGIGAIYAIIGDTPALLTDVGSDKTADNRVLSMSAYERGLFFVSNSNIWRWDLVNGGYSHWAGPLDSTATLSYTDITWATWDMAAIPGTGAEPDLSADSPVVVGTTSAAFTGAMAITLSSTSAARTYKALADAAAGATNGFSDATGITLEVDVPANFINDHNHATQLEAIIEGSTKGAWMVVSCPSAFSTTYEVSIDGTGTKANISRSAHTLRFTLSSGSGARVYCDNTLILSEAYSRLASASTAKQVSIGASRSVAGATPDVVTVNRVRWSDDGAFDPRVSLTTAVTGVGIACWRDKVAAACSGVGCAVTSSTDYETTVLAESEEPPYLRSSRSSGNMPTVDKYFSAIHVLVAGALDHTFSNVTVSGTIDGQAFTADEDATASSDTLLVFPIGLTGRSIQYQVNIENDSTVSGSSGYTPVITEVAVLFDPTPKTASVHSYYLRVWENVECRDGSLWDQSPSIVSPWLEDIANTAVTISRPGREDYTGRIEVLKNAEAPPSGRTSEFEGLYQLAVRRLS